MVMNMHPLLDPMAVSDRAEAFRGMRQLPRDALLEFHCHHNRSQKLHIVVVRYNSVDITNLVALVINAQIHYGGLTANVKDIEQRLRDQGVVWLASILIMV
jgi:hypothetical protein